MSDNTLANKRKAEFLEDFYEMLSKEIIIAYRGTFEKSVLGVLAQNIESTIDSSSVLRKKFFKLFLELSQNISDHSAEIMRTSTGDESGSGLLILKYKGDNYQYITGNLIKTENLEAIQESISNINSLSREELRKQKRQQIELSETGKNSYLGLIQIALISGHDIEIKAIDAENDQTFLILSAEVLKED